MNFEHLLSVRNKTNAFARHIGITLTKLSEGFAEAVLPIEAQHMNLIHSVHGGCLYTLADVAAGACVASFGYVAVTASGTYHYLASARDIHSVTAVASIVKRGHHLAVLDVTLTDNRKKTIGKATFTYYITQEKLTYHEETKKSPAER